MGASGYLGSEALRLLAQHPDLKLTHAVSSHHAGEKLGSLCPWLSSGRDLVLTSDASAMDVDVALLALPSGEAPALVPGLLERGIRVVDMGPDYRLKDPEVYQATYGRPHADLDHLPEAVYGLTELAREEVAKARLIANPGCYPTATLLALLPLAREKLLPPHIIVDAKSGTSGAGTTPGPLTHHPQAGASVNAYGEGKHRHGPEIRQALTLLGGAMGEDASQVTFVPHIVPVVRGILCTIYAPGVPAGAVESWTETLAQTYADSPFVRLGPVPKLPWVQGSNACQLATQAAPPSVVLFSAIDNLVKGGAGQAIQNANLMMGLPETAGLPQGGLGP